MRTLYGVLFSAHIAAGAALGFAVRRPLLAFPLGVLSHFAMDAVPHWAVASDPRTWLLIAACDGLLGIMLAIGLAVVAPRSRRAAVLAGIAGAALPDMDKPFAQLLGWQPFPAWWEQLHAGVQHESLGNWWVDALVLASFAGLSLVAFRRSAHDRIGASAPFAGAACLPDGSNP